MSYSAFLVSQFSIPNQLLFDSEQWSIISEVIFPDIDCFHTAIRCLKLKIHWNDIWSVEMECNIQTFSLPTNNRWLDLMLIFFLFLYQNHAQSRNVKKKHSMLLLTSQNVRLWFCVDAIYANIFEIVSFAMFVAKKKRNSRYNQMIHENK